MSAEDERSRPATTPDGFNAQMAPATANSVHGTAAGLQQAVDNADPLWMSAALWLIAKLAEDNRLVCSCSIYGHEWIGDPDHASRLGAAFSTAHRDGLIEYVAHHKAVRSSRAGGVHSVWRGVSR